ncbi:DNA-binding protein [Herbiconiux sp.]|uniref:helix-turn-helix transcriptional regulator n=1 Tax=Herbiconiux sp. TaxID=1871186 RepID=UPI0025B8E121|nr:DNA-binding protein [Herbiconiux sp.]
MNAMLSPSQLPERTGLALQPLTNWRSLGKGPAHFELGRLVRYWEHDVEAWLADQL